MQSGGAKSMSERHGTERLNVYASSTGGLRLAEVVGMIEEPGSQGECVKSFEAVEQLDHALQAYLKSDPEAARQVFAKQGVDPTALVEMFLGWWANLREIHQSGELLPPSIAVIDAAILRALRRAKTAISRSSGGESARSFISFFEELAHVSVLIGAVDGANPSVARFEGRQQLKRAMDSAKGISLAAEEASQSLKEIASSVLQVRNERDQIKEDGKRANALLADAEAVRATSESFAKTLSDRSADAARLHSEIQSLRDGADAKKDHFELALDGVREKSAQAEAYLANTVSELRSTLDSVKRHGLASAFAERASSLKSERYLWIAIFVTALCGLTAVSIFFAAKLESLTYEAILSGLFRRVALAAPLVWLGWYAARQVGTLSRLKEDYDYKAATALAFEGYQKEVSSSGDHQLIAKLLGTAITNFGENPVRLYGSSEDAASPSEEVIRRLLIEDGLGIAERVKAILAKK